MRLVRSPCCCCCWLLALVCCCCCLPHHASYCFHGTQSAARVSVRRSWSSSFGGPGSETAAATRSPPLVDGNFLPSVCVYEEAAGRARPAHFEDFLSRFCCRLSCRRRVTTLRTACFMKRDHHWPRERARATDFKVSPAPLVGRLAEPAS